ncbi:hypothetical protein ACIQKB_25035 [Streptomyces sp. NPDC092046]|uniref:hypothetical protein n=1 Tax=Streptomyces sp. NPDC092046 TaxID=3366009 RepID=UPI0037FD7AB1
MRGPFNLVADPVLDTSALARLLNARTVPLPAAAARTALAAAWRLHLVPAAPGPLGRRPATASPRRGPGR